MRLTAAGLAVLLIAVALPPMLPGASACRISLSEPTKPAMSKDCTEVPDVTLETLQERSINLGSLPGGDLVMNKTDLCRTEDVCEWTVSVYLRSAVEPTDREDPLQLAFDAWVDDEENRVTFDSEECDTGGIPVQSERAISRESLEPCSVVP